MYHKTCKTCHENKPEIEYHKSPTNRDGLNSECKLCRKVKASEDYKKNWFQKVVGLKKSYCKTRGIPFDLDKEYLESIWTDSCPVFDKPFVRHDKRNDMCPALDRVEPTLGYVKGNVRFISARANRIKYDASVEELKQVLVYVEGATTIP